MSVPKTIYLQIGDADLEYWEELVGVTWSPTRINESDVEYKLTITK